MIVYTDRDKVPFQIDEDDWEIVKHYTWRIHHSGRPVTNTGKNKCQRSIFVHSLLLGKAPAGLEWDHHNRDKLDNRRDNLRAVARKINILNRGLRQDNTSGIKGVQRYRDGKRWVAAIRDNGKCHHLGLFDYKEQAEAARHKAEFILWEGV